MQPATQIPHEQNNSMSWLQFLGVLFILFPCLSLINILLTLLPIELYGYINPDTNNFLLDSIENVSYELVALLLLIVFITKYKPLKELVLPIFDFRVLKSFQMYIYVLIYYVLTLFVDMLVLDKLFPSSVQEQSDALQLSALEHYPLLLLLAGGIFAPIFEELVCRGILLRFFEEKFTFWSAVILSSLIFGIAHTYSVGIMVSAFMTGIFACLLYKQTKSVIPAILLHILTNIIAFST
ncbi:MULTISPECIES: CPBP family intramembrane glutamic endopeptidase [Bacillus cereus group]|uniref:CPBP family intramembrane metalloprotease n=1 Tax=Bacillus proteolyticus TaxID=2026192 RepID=A0ABV3I5U1_9BACI|nr:type II CAAX endopeptidase family protein [Bacillus cereus group sp. N8]MBJ8104676.1 CPBP family intramembrane metalloprotease [Bacillus cereus group sp. N8]